MSLDPCEGSENTSESPLTAGKPVGPRCVPSAAPGGGGLTPPLGISPCCAMASMRDSINSRYNAASTNGEPGGEKDGEERKSMLEFKESVGESASWIV